ncbi:MAG: hypothetical protein J3Q66DRAFT_344521 [Benniella sp.]|nr:MAG: hypothetical protein J3Q66DRAFT_344521 [Benniella sp.]
MLDQATQERGSSIALLNCRSASLTSSGLDALERVISRSKYPVFATLRITGLHEKTRVEAAINFLGRFKSRLKELDLNGDPETRWLLQLVRAFPLRIDFPVLEKLRVVQTTTLWGSQVDDEFSNDTRHWLTLMVSVPPQPLTRLKYLELIILLLPQDVSAIIEAIDLSAMEELLLAKTLITQEQRERLVDRITDDSMPPLPLSYLNLDIRMKSWAYIGSTQALWKKLRAKFPLIKGR